MTEQERLELAARLIVHADTWERIGANHRSFQDGRLVRDLRAAAAELRILGDGATQKDGE